MGTKGSSKATVCTAVHQHAGFVEYDRMDLFGISPKRCNTLQGLNGCTYANPCTAQAFNNCGYTLKDMNSRTLSMSENAEALPKPILVNGNG
jgi:hypothetical protein